MSTGADQRCFLVSKDVVVPLSSQQPVVLGRDPAASNFVLSDDRVSRVHAMVLYREGQYLVKDLNSSNGTFVNGKRVTGMVALKAGDRISISPFALEFVRPQHATMEEAAGSPLENRNKFEGSIATLPVSDLVQLLNATMQSGVLTLTDADQQQADLVFVDGEIEQAHYKGLVGEQAVFSLLREHRGRFEFTKLDRTPVASRLVHQPGASDAGATIDGSGERQIKRRTQSLLLEGARLIDESFASAPPSLNPGNATTRDSSTAPDLRSLGNLLD